MKIKPQQMIMLSMLLETSAHAMEKLQTNPLHEPSQRSTQVHSPESSVASQRGKSSVSGIKTDQTSQNIQEKNNSTFNRNREEDFVSMYTISTSEYQLKPEAQYYSEHTELHTLDALIDYLTHNSLDNKHNFPKKPDRYIGFLHKLALKYLPGDPDLVIFSKLLENPEFKFTGKGKLRGMLGDSSAKERAAVKNIRGRLLKKFKAMKFRNSEEGKSLDSLIKWVDSLPKIVNFRSEEVKNVLNTIENVIANKTYASVEDDFPEQPDLNIILLHKVARKFLIISGDDTDFVTVSNFINSKRYNTDIKKLPSGEEERQAVDRIRYRVLNKFSILKNSR